PQSAASSLSPPRLLTESSAGVESSEPCRTESTDRRVVALPHPRGDGTTQPPAPPLWHRRRLPLAILPGLHPDPPRHGDRPEGAGCAGLVARSARREGLGLADIGRTRDRHPTIRPPLHLRVDGPIPHAAMPGLEGAPGDHQSLRHRPCP